MPALNKYDGNGGAACLSAVRLLPITHLRPRMEFFLRAMKGLLPTFPEFCEVCSATMDYYFFFNFLKLI